MTVTLPYFETSSPLRWESDQSYAGSATTAPPVMALLDAGLAGRE